MISSLLILATLGIPNAISGIIAWELGKKANYKIHGNKAFFIPKDAIFTHKKWSDMK